MHYNAEVCYKLDNSSRSTDYNDYIKLFQCAKDEEAAWLALTIKYAGEDKLEAEIKNQYYLTHTKNWTGQRNFTLERFIQQHRNKYILMQSCA